MPLKPNPSNYDVYSDFGVRTKPKFQFFIRTWTKFKIIILADNKIVMSPVIKFQWKKNAQTVMTDKLIFKNKNGYNFFRQICHVLWIFSG